MEIFRHIVDRETIHLGLQSPPVLALGVMFILAMLRRLLKYEWLPQRIQPTCFWSCVAVLIVFLFREPYDVGIVQDPWIKSYIDFAFNALSLVLLFLAVRKLEQWSKRGCL